MTEICYVPKDFTDAHMDVIIEARSIMEDYRAQGHKLTLRQLYYQFISKDFFPNTVQSYKRLGSIMTDARLAGEISWTMIEDRDRTCSTHYSQPDPTSVLDGVEYGYSEDMWEDQDCYLEVWVEKEALSSVIERPCNRWDVPHMACRGYMSSSAAWEAGQRFKDASDLGKECILIHLGDHDPSGLDMTRDNGERASMFAECDVDVQRIALNMDQIQLHNPPPNPTKLSDSRASDYINLFGYECWELDALTPTIIGDLISKKIEGYLDMTKWTEKKQREEKNRFRLRKIGDNAADVFQFIDDHFGDDE